jgi:PAS domain S-box-containing protein
MTGYLVKEVEGKNDHFLQGDDKDQEGQLTIIRESIKQQARLVALRNYRKDGSMFWNELNKRFNLWKK